LTAPDGGEPLPPLYARWVSELLGGAIPREARATCDACPMQTQPAQESQDRLYFFDPVVKCCTYVPELYSFLVGRILADTDPLAQAGRATVEKRIAGGVGVTPLGLMQSPVFSLLYGSSSDSFGRSRTFRCPHFLEDTGRCGVWRHRESTCATWFCKHVRGSLGYAFWRKALHYLLEVVERDLARWCVHRLFASDETLQHVVASSAWKAVAEPVTGDSIDNRVTPKAYAGLWGEWRGREQEFYGRCADLVSPLSWGEVLAICGPEARAYERLTRHAYQRLTSQEVPPTLSVGSFHLIQIQRGVSRINTYSDYDPLDVPGAVMEALPYFDDRSTEDALAKIEKERGLRLDPALLQKMVDFGLLVRPK
jgi:hypothetical protein